MNKMQKAFAAVGIVSPSKDFDYPYEMTRCSTISNTERRRGAQAIFGRWILQFNRPELGLVKEMIWRAKQ